MSVIEFKNKWQLTSSEVSIVLGLAEYTCRQYTFSPASSSYRPTPPWVQMHMRALDELWSLKGYLPGNKRQILSDAYSEVCA